MLLILLLLFPVLEIYIFIQAIDEFGFWVMLFEAIFTAWLGFTILKFRSLIVMGAVHKTLKRKSKPEAEMVKSLLIFMGALLLIVPGLITDVIGLLCLFAPTRGLIGLFMKRHISKMAQSGQFRMVYNKVPFSGAEDFSGFPKADSGIRDVGPGTQPQEENNLDVVKLESPDHPFRDRQ